MPLTHRRAAGVLVAIILGLSPLHVSAGTCKTNDGSFTSTLVPPPTCTSPIGVCTMGTLNGRFEETYYFVMDTLVPIGDSETDFMYTGHSVITRTHGGAKLFGQDTGVITFTPPGVPSPFVTTVNVVGGTKQYATATGQFVATGQLDFSTGAASGTFTSNVCK